MKKKFGFFTLLFLFIGSLPVAAKIKTPLNETTLSLYCRNMFYAADKEIPTQLKHSCNVEFCLLNLPETYNGASNQIKAIEYLESKILEWDPDGRSLRHFYRLWSQKPAGLGSPPRPLNVD
jgi:hypothetical protein